MWTLLQDDARAAFGTHGAMVVAVLRAPLDVPFFDDLDRLIAEMSSAAPASGISILLVRAGGSPGAMTPDVRERTGKLLREHQARLRAFAYVNAGAGLKAKLLRGAMNAALMASGFTGKVFTDVDEGLAWLVGLSGQPAELRAAAPEIRRQVRALGA